MKLDHLIVLHVLVIESPMSAAKMLGVSDRRNSRLPTSWSAKLISNYLKKKYGVDSQYCFPEQRVKMILHWLATNGYIERSNTILPRREKIVELAERMQEVKDYEHLCYEIRNHYEPRTLIKILRGMGYVE